MIYYSQRTHISLIVIWRKVIKGSLCIRIGV
ncbi:hypothetical protein NITGR_360011 [Nitrospina gracilis 3/211]|uniref:Uncharacterized protein n=1 Tax=Nitrospina gracilis (strain 3/211) TaxID=1266370 RepID=M1YYC6_NITG3|nr:hypothetical protein NITGR_360011 [Nitrospina gracilis 3/211]